MAFTLFYLLESALLIANAIAILNERFLSKSMWTPNKISSLAACWHNNVDVLLFFVLVGFNIDQMDMSVPQADQ